MGSSKDKKLQDLLEKRAEENKALKKILNSISSLNKKEKTSTKPKK
ncbi:hypothetical protein [Ancylomarina sp.]